MHQLKGIKNIIFDFGGVIYDIDFMLSMNAFRRLGIDFGNTSFNNYLQHDIFGKLEKGEVDTEEFISIIQQQLEHKHKKETIIEAWNALLLGSTKERIELIQALSTKYRIFLLSNTNEIHSKKFLNEMNTEYKVDFLSLFEKTYMSHQYRLAKPELRFYQIVLNENHLIAQETLFIDDNLANIKAAKSLGIKTYHFHPENEDLGDVFL